MTYEDYITDAIALVTPWNLPDEELLKCIHEQAELMLGIDDYFIDTTSDYPYQIPLNPN